MRYILGLMLILVAAPARADRCAQVDRDTADAAVAIIDEAGSVLFDDWFAPIAVADVRWTREGFLYRVVVNGELGLDLAYSYVPGGDDKTYESLGWMVGCGDGDAPKSIPAQPFLPAAGDDGAATPGAGRIGLVALPALDAWDWTTGEARQPQPIIVYAGAAVDAATRATLESWDDLPNDEYGYERAGAVALERRDGWTRIALAGGSGWVAAADAGTFHAHETLVGAGLAYLSAAWDGRLWAASGGAGPARAIDPAWRRHMGAPIGVEPLDAARVDGVLWLHVAIVWPPPCVGDPPRRIAEGWVTALAPSGAPAVWFHSRGC